MRCRQRFRDVRLGVIVQLDGAVVQLGRNVLCTHPQRIGHGHHTAVAQLTGGGVDDNGVVHVASFAYLLALLGQNLDVAVQGDKCLGVQVQCVAGSGVGVGFAFQPGVGGPFRIVDLDRIADHERLDLGGICVRNAAQAAQGKGEGLAFLRHACGNLRRYAPNRLAAVVCHPKTKQRRFAVLVISQTIRQSVGDGDSVVILEAVPAGDIQHQLVRELLFAGGIIFIDRLRFFILVPAWQRTGDFIVRALSDALFQRSRLPGLGVGVRSIAAALVGDLYRGAFGNIAQVYQSVVAQLHVFKAAARILGRIDTEFEAEDFGVIVSVRYGGTFCSVAGIACQRDCAASSDKIITRVFYRCRKGRTSDWS